MNGGTVRDEADAGVAFRNIVVLRARQRLELVGTRLDGGGFRIDACVGMMRLDEADVVKEELVAVRGAEHAFLEENPDLWSRALVVVGINFDDD